jgi:hypothetical protein
VSAEQGECRLRRSRRPPERVKASEPSADEVPTGENAAPVSFEKTTAPSESWRSKTVIETLKAPVTNSIRQCDCSRPDTFVGLRNGLAPAPNGQFFVVTTTVRDPAQPASVVLNWQPER